MDTVRILLGGDIMLARGVTNTINREGPEFIIRHLSKLTKQKDLFFANLECALARDNTLYEGPEKTFYFRAEPYAVQVLKLLGIDMVSLANNHILDAGTTGLTDTLSILRNNNIEFCGAGRNSDEAFRPYIVRKNGIRIGVLAFCDHQEDFAAAPNRPGISYVKLRDVRSARKITTHISKLAEIVDFVIVSIHWQPNWAPEIDKLYRSLAMKMAEAGAGLIWGHSPHHFQCIEWFDATPVIYSSGDLLNDYTVDPHYRNDLQLLFDITIQKDKVLSVVAHPLKLDYAETKPLTNEKDIQWINKRLNQFCSDMNTHFIWQENHFLFQPQPVEVS